MPSSTETTTTNSTRELAAIMFSDIAGYTAIMGRDEQEGLEARNAHRELLQTILPRFNGRLLGDLGDGALSSFHSAIDAVNCARAFQAATGNDPRFKIRVGIHLGDVLFADNTVLGDGVNVASRLVALAEPGGICISEKVYDEIRNQRGMSVKSLGLKTLKNVTRPISVYVLGSGADASTAMIAPSAVWRTAGLVALATVGATAVAVVYFVTRHKPAVPAATPSVAASAVAPHPIQSIAVLPLDNFSGDPKDEYFADGMTDELTTDLAKISALRVISRGSAMRYKGAQRPPTPEIAKALNVDALVEGSVMKSGDKVRITAQLIDAPSDKHLWAESYERDTRDVLALQDEVALAIAREINVELTPHQQERLSNARPVNPQAYEAYLKGRYLLQTYDPGREVEAVRQFEQAIQADPNFALAHSGLADAYSYEALFLPQNDVMPKAKAAAEKALQLDDNLAEAHTSLALVKFQYDFDWAGSEREFHQAITLNPNYAEAHHLYAFMLACQGRFDESEAEYKRAFALDPLSSVIRWDAGQALLSQGKFEAAKAQWRKALELDPNDSGSQTWIAIADLVEGRSKEAIAALEKLDARFPSSPFTVASLGAAYALAGQRAKAEAVLEQLNQISSSHYVDPANFARILVALGDKGRALDQLENAYEARSIAMDLLKVEKTWDPLRSEPRFIELLKKVGLG